MYVQIAIILIVLGGTGFGTWYYFIRGTEKLVEEPLEEDSTEETTEPEAQEDPDTAEANSKPEEPGCYVKVKSDTCTMDNPPLKDEWVKMEGEEYASTDSCLAAEQKWLTDCQLEQGDVEIFFKEAA